MTCPHGYTANYDCPFCPCACGRKACAECTSDTECEAYLQSLDEPTAQEEKTK